MESALPLDASLGERVSRMVGRMVGGAEPWRVLITDRPVPEAHLFADRTLHLSRGALVDRAGPESLRELFQRAEDVYGTGFRDPETRALTPQPARLDPTMADSGVPESGVPESGRDDWLDLLDGLVFGEPARMGAERDGEVFLTGAGLRLLLPDGFAFQSHVGERFDAASDAGRWFHVDHQSPGAETLDSPEADLEAEREQFTQLARMLEPVAMAEAVRVRNWLGVRGRRVVDGAVAALVALVAVPPGSLHLELECGATPFRTCEREFLGVLESMRDLDGVEPPGALRVVAFAPPASAAGRTARAILQESASDAPIEALLRLNRGFLELPLAPGDRLLLLRRDPPAAPSSLR